MSLEPPRVKYPITDNKKWGPNYWFYFHENASLYPDQPTDEDRSSELNHINYFVSHLPCKATCGPNATKFVQDNPPDLTSKKAYFGWTVKFHNAINTETGSQENIENPDELLGDGKCESCKIPEAEQGADLSHDTEVQFSNSVKAYKEAVRQLVINTYKKHGKKPPDQIIFNKCADKSDTSCAITVKNNDGSRKHYTFYNPKDIVSTIFHEIDHGIDAGDGKEISDNLNDKADKFADTMIKDHFPFDEFTMDKQGNINLAHDVIVRESVPIPQATATADAHAVVKGIYGQNENQFSADPEDPKILNEFPHLKQTLMEIKKEELKGEIREFEHRGGFLSHFDKVYSYPAGLTGLKPEQLNILHTPTIIAAIGETLASAFFAPLPKALVTSLFGIFLMVMGIGFHKKMTTRDIMFVQSLGSQLMWNTAIPTLNPKQFRRIKKDAQRLMDLARSKNLHIGDIIETPDQDTTSFSPGKGIGVGAGQTFGNSGRGKPIPQGIDRITQSVSEVENPDYFESLSDQSVLQLPRFTSRSHARFL